MIDPKSRLLSTFFVLELFSGSISQEKNRRQKRPIAPEGSCERQTDYGLVRKYFSEWLCVWKMNIPEGYPYNGDLLHFAQKKKKPGLLI